MAATGEAEGDAIERVLHFWFTAGDEELWFKPSDAFDQAVRQALGDDYERAAAGRYESWRDTARGCLALVLLLDQVPRNLFRGGATAYATDDRALAVARHAIARGFDLEIAEQSERVFLYLPLEHSERLADQEDCCRLMAALDENPEWLEWAVQHRDVIARFGRFPHRNAVLGRQSTAEEIEFLEQPDSSF
ncbi:MAG: DUF924 family protein [Kiloniellales bacterium]|nr:DUF924 family protein [Kiloniellales bacterium]